MSKAVSKSIPRLGLEAMPAELADYLRRTKVERLGYLGEFFQCGANAPDALLSFMRFTDVLGEALPKRLVEVVALSERFLLDSPSARHAQGLVRSGCFEQLVAHFYRTSMTRAVSESASVALLPRLLLPPHAAEEES